MEVDCARKKAMVEAVLATTLIKSQGNAFQLQSGFEHNCRLESLQNVQ
jgi:hypothetical protein